MKKIAVLITLLAIGMLIIVGGCKKDDSPTEEKKKYAWATGKIDSTGYGTILFTSDAGETWARQGIDNPAFEGVEFSDIWAIDENTVWATGSKNTILKTTNGGLNWVKVTPPAQIPEAGLGCINIYEKNNIWISGAVGGTGIIYRSTDGGNTFTLLDTTYFQRKAIQGVLATGPGQVYATGGDIDRGETGFISNSTDNGITWDSIVLDDNYNKWEWISVVSFENTIVVYGGKGRYTVSTDGGTSWNNDSIPIGGVNGADINYLKMIDAQTWWAACDLGNVWKTSNGGDHWTQQSVPDEVKNSFMVGLDIWDRDIALMVASGFHPPFDGPILKTKNGGDQWEKVYTADAPLWKISFIRD